MSDAMKEVKEKIRMVVKDDEIFDLEAQMIRKSYLALINEGFSEEQATIIVAGKSVVNIS